MRGGAYQTNMSSGVERNEGQESKEMESLKEGSNYKFLGVLENIRQEDNLILENVGGVYLKRLSVIWTIPLSDYN